MLRYKQISNIYSSGFSVEFLHSSSKWKSYFVDQSLYFILRWSKLSHVLWLLRYKQISNIYSSGFSLEFLHSSSKWRSHFVDQSLYFILRWSKLSYALLLLRYKGIPTCTTFALSLREYFAMLMQQSEICSRISYPSRITRFHLFPLECVYSAESKTISSTKKH